MKQKSKTDDGMRCDAAAWSSAPAPTMPRPVQIWTDSDAAPLSCTPVALRVDHEDGHRRHGDQGAGEDEQRAGGGRRPVRPVGGPYLVLGFRPVRQQGDGRRGEQCRDGVGDRAAEQQRLQNLDAPCDHDSQRHRPGGLPRVQVEQAACPERHEEVGRLHGEAHDAGQGDVGVQDARRDEGADRDPRRGEGGDGRHQAPMAPQGAGVGVPEEAEQGVPQREQHDKLGVVARRGARSDRPEHGVAQDLGRGDAQPHPQAERYQPRRVVPLSYHRVSDRRLPGLVAML